MDKIIKAKLILPAYLTVDAKELIRNVSTDESKINFTDCEIVIDFN